jgi:hypothetical protein
LNPIGHEEKQARIVPAGDARHRETNRIRKRKRSARRGIAAQRMGVPDNAAPNGNSASQRQVRMTKPLAGWFRTK